MKASDRTAAELEALKDLPDAKIDTTEVPEREDWTGAVRGRFHRQANQSAQNGPFKRMSDAQRAEIRRLLRGGMGRFEIAQEVGVTPGQVSAIKAWMTMSAPLQNPTTEEGGEIVEAVETTIGLERDLQHTLRQNIAQLDPDLTIADDGREQRVRSGGFIDILAKDADGGIVVIELKAGRADRDAIGQVLAYMGELMHEGTLVRGIIVAAEFSPRAIAAAKAAPNVRLFRYGVHFSFGIVSAPLVAA